MDEFQIISQNKEEVDQEELITNTKKTLIKYLSKRLK